MSGQKRHAHPPGLGPCAAQQPEEEGSPDGGRQHAQRQLLVLHDGAREQVGQHQHCRATERASRQNDPVSRSCGHPDQVGHDQADERDDAGERHTGRRQQGSGGDEHPADPLDVQPEVACRSLAQGQQVEAARMPQRDTQTDGGQRCGDSDGGPGGVVEAAQVPERHGRAGIVVGQVHQQSDHSSGHRVDGDAGQQERHHLGAATGPGQAVDEEGGREPTSEGGDGGRPGAEPGQAERDDGERADSGAGTDADDCRLGQRVAEYALHDGSSAAERGSDDHAEEHAWEAHLPQRRVALRVRGQRSQLEPEPVQQRPDHLLRRHAHLPGACGNDDRDEQRATRPASRTGPRALLRLASPWF